jgi:hypothetical protein
MECPGKWLQGLKQSASDGMNKQLTDRLISIEASNCPVVDGLVSNSIWVPDVLVE